MIPQAYIITPDSHVQPLTQPPSFEGLYKFIQTDTVQVVRSMLVATPFQVWLDEDGKMKGKPVNLLATLIARAAQAIAQHDVIVGTAVITGPVNVHGDDTPINSAALGWLNGYFENYRLAVGA